jgi:hypothetical protein
MILKEISNGITHIEDLSARDFMYVLGNLGQYEITEKLDGAQMLFGIDEYGLYTSRESKGGKRIYNEKDYGLSFSSTYIRSAHILLHQSKSILEDAGLRPGDQVEAEVLFGQLPNVVPYSADRNYLIFLRTTEGRVNIDRLKQKLSGRTSSISLVSPITEDGRTIQFKETAGTWEFSRSPILKIPVTNTNIKLNRMIKYLGTVDAFTSQSYGTLLETPLNKTPDWVPEGTWKSVKEYLRDRKEELRTHLESEYIYPIKEKLLDQLVRPTTSKFGPALEEGGWIEGVVLRHISTGRMVKVIDKEVFGTVREAAWERRNKLTEHAKSPDSELSFMGSMFVDMARALGHPHLGTIQAKNYLRKAGSINEERISSLTDGVDVESVKNYWLNIFEIKLAHLSEDLDKYEKEEEKSGWLETDRTRKAIYERTTQTYATSFQKMYRLREATLQAKKVDDLLMILVGKQLDDLA